MKIKLLILLCALISSYFSFGETKKINITFYQIKIKSKFSCFSCCDDLSYTKKKPFSTFILHDCQNPLFSFLREHIKQVLYESRVYNPALGGLQFYTDSDPYFNNPWNNGADRFEPSVLSGFVVIQKM